MFVPFIIREVCRNKRVVIATYCAAHVYIFGLRVSVVSVLIVLHNLKDFYVKLNIAIETQALKCNHGQRV